MPRAAAAPLAPPTLQSELCNAPTVASRWNLGQRRIASGRLARFPSQRAIVDRQDLRVAKDHRPLDHVLQLSNVSRPAVRFEVGGRSIGDPRNRLSLSSRMALDEQLGERKDVFPSSASAAFRVPRGPRFALESSASRMRFAGIPDDGTDPPARSMSA